jgi:hypothetical protein
MPLLAQEDCTVHKLLDGVKPDEVTGMYGYQSVTVASGTVFQDSEVPPYVLEAAKKGAGPLKRISDSDAKKVEAEAAAVALAEAADGPVQEINASNADEDHEEA